MKKFKYLSIFILPIVTLISFKSVGFWTFFPVLFLFGLVPLLELLFKPDRSNFEEAERAFASTDSYYTNLLYLTVLVHISLLFYFLIHIGEMPRGAIEYIGQSISMGLMCGIFGINIGHELGHRPRRIEQLLGEIALLSSLEMHFIPYHNSGHHLNVATPGDPATARKNEWLYLFWFRSQVGSYFQAWRIEGKRMQKTDHSFWSWPNRMIRYTIIQTSLLGGIYYFLGGSVLIAFLLAATTGILLLETVNYIEHYGLLRNKTESGRYERVQHWHSWNSDHVIGRLLLFELSRHSDHHYKASKHYQTLNSFPESPQMPTGYPGMMLLALVPPLWIRLMNKRLD